MRNHIINLGFIEFVETNFDVNEHRFMVWGTGPVSSKKNRVYLLKYPYHIMTFFHLFKMNIQMYKAPKIILHGLTNPILVFLLFLQPWILFKCYWVMWGGDFYFPEKKSYFRKVVIRKIKHCITYIKGDYEFIQKWYGTQGAYCECLMYPSNLYKDRQVKKTESDSLLIQVGNSADPSNNHLVVFSKLEKFKSENIEVAVPLSYGNRFCVRRVLKAGRKSFGNKFRPLIEFMSFENYLEYLERVDIAIFNHKRQQAMGNIITLLGFGKKVHLRTDITPWKLFEDIGVAVYPVDDINLELLGEDEKILNQIKIKNFFSKNKLVQQWWDIFND
jgi:hypothetical protein